MLGSLIDSVVGIFSPRAELQRRQARKVLRSYSGAESNRLTNNKRPKNQSADSELLGPFGADALRAWARELVRNNAYAWGVVDTIVSSVVGRGIQAQSMLETAEGDDIEDVNDVRDSVWSDWCEACDVNGQYNFAEMQAIIQREMVEAGEVLVHFVKRRDGRRVPLALELIEADRLATDRDTYAAKQADNRIIRGVEIDELGKPVAYWIYPEHPNSPYITRNTTPKRIPAAEILHLFRRDRIGQTRGVSWFAPVLSTARDLSIYIDNELQASAIAACFCVAIKTATPMGGLAGPSGDDTQDANGNTFENIEPGIVTRLNPGDDISAINPGRPNSNAAPWISLLLRSIAVGTGLSYEVVARDYSGTSYSSSRTSMLEDRRRFRRWQQYLIDHFCQPVWDRFCEAAALVGIDGFPTATDLLDNRRKAAPVEWQRPEWEWVDPQSEQASSQAAIDGFQSTYQAEIGARGGSWRGVFYQRAKEEKLKRQLGLQSATDAENQLSAAQANQANATAATVGVDGAVATPSATGEMSNASTLQFRRNAKAINETLDQFASGQMSEAKARVFLASVGLTQSSIDALIQDAMDGTVDQPVPEDEVARQVRRNCGIGSGGFQPGNSCGKGGGGGGNTKASSKLYAKKVAAAKEKLGEKGFKETSEGKFSKEIPGTEGMNVEIEAVHHPAGIDEYGSETTEYVSYKVTSESGMNEFADSPAAAVTLANKEIRNAQRERLRDISYGINEKDEESKKAAAELKEALKNKNADLDEIASKISDLQSKSDKFVEPV